MRQGWCWAVAVTAVGSMVACGGSAPAAGPDPDELVLEVGGDQPSLRAQLSAVGRTIGEPRRISAGPGEASQVPGVDPKRTRQLAPADGPEGGEDLADDPGPGPDPALGAESESPWVVVELPRGETLIHLARRHLGDGNRFADLLRWNGWTEDDARRLREGQPVRIRRSALVKR